MRKRNVATNRLDKHPAEQQWLSVSGTPKNNGSDTNGRETLAVAAPEPRLDVRRQNIKARRRVVARVSGKLVQRANANIDLACASTNERTGHATNPFGFQCGHMCV